MTGSFRRRIAIGVVLVTIFAGITAFPLSAQDQNVIIGVLAKRGIDQTYRQWNGMAQYLDERIPGYSFQIRPLPFDQVSPAVMNREIEFVLVNSAMYVELEINHGVARISTMKNHQAGYGFIVFGSAVVIRADRTDLEQASSSRGMRVAAVDPGSFGGWLMAKREFLEAGIDPDQDFRSLEFLDTHDAVVYAVESGACDLGVVRTDTLERMTAEGLISLGDYRVLPFSSVSVDPSFPFLHSTRLYPEWPMATLAHTDSRLAELVAAELIAMPPEDPAARAAHIDGWTIPLNYQPVHECLRVTRYGPYSDYGRVTLAAVIAQYGLWILGLLVATVVTIIALVMFLRRNHELETIRRHLADLVEARTYDLSVKAKQLERSLDEKQALLAEIHHRVKNNLQVISSLLNLQQDQIHDDAARRIMKTLQLRVETMSLVHESLEAIANAASMPVTEYIRSLAVQAMESEIGTTATVDLSFELEDVRLDLARAVPFGLVVCELFTNAFRHGRRPEHRLTVHASLHRVSFETIVFTVSDNGPGCRQRRQESGTDHLGLLLVRLLVEQLRGNYSITDTDHSTGTLVTITFPGADGAGESELVDSDSLITRVGNADV